MSFYKTKRAYNLGDQLWTLVDIVDFVDKIVCRFCPQSQQCQQCPQCPQLIAQAQTYKVK